MVPQSAVRFQRPCKSNHLAGYRTRNLLLLQGCLCSRILCSSHQTGSQPQVWRGKGEYSSPVFPSLYNCNYVQFIMFIDIEIIIITFKQCVNFLYFTFQLTRFTLESFRSIQRHYPRMFIELEQLPKDERGRIEFVRGLEPLPSISGIMCSDNCELFSPSLEGTDMGEALWFGW